MTGTEVLGSEIIRVSRLSKIYDTGTQALLDVSFSANAGETLILLGSNGSGKSTLQKCLNGLVQPTSGSVNVLGTEVSSAGKKQLRALRRQVGMVHQRINLVRELSVLSNVIHGSLGWATSARNWFGATAKQEQRELAMDALDRVGLASVAARRAEQLSGGQQQRVAIARMLLQRPKIVLADEPVAALDPRAGRAVMDMLWQIAEEESLTLVCTLHQLELARAYGSRVIALRQGRLDLDTHMAEVRDSELAGLYTHEATEEEPVPAFQGVRP
ncbi:phosphonate ABC transporter ATP-binding protein [Glutamicibacter uratoxydans]|uniref:phosphonate ABC transporter ATP-binding protein n=1 Tax=Glutamicibacter uratoxydans TaxID=43667 RepID=UPI003D6E0523